jgi:hypothetical protein
LFAGVFARSFAAKVRFDAGRSNSVEYVEREYVTGNYFDVLGVKPAIGRLFKTKTTAPRRVTRWSS